MEEKLLQLYEKMSGAVENGFLCEGCSAECCYFELSGHLPFLTHLEWNLILKHTGEELPPVQVIICPFLDQKGNTCSIYEVRPFKCRLYYCSRYPGTNSLFNHYSIKLNPFLEEYQRLTNGLPEWSIIDLLNEY